MDRNEVESRFNAAVNPGGATQGVDTSEMIDALTSAVNGGTMLKIIGIIESMLPFFQNDLPRLLTFLKSLLA